MKKYVVCIGAAMVAVLGFFVWGPAPKAAAATVPDYCYQVSFGQIDNYDPTPPGCSVSDLTIPSVVNGQTIIRIATAAFSGEDTFTSVTLPSSLLYIDTQAFGYNTSLTSVTFDSALQTIGPQAFASTGLTDVVIPDSVTSIGDDAFTSSAITSLDLGSGVTSIGDEAFDYNQIASLTFPASLSGVGARAFAQNNLTSLTIPATLTTIGDGAFADNQLRSLVLPAGMTSIAANVFAGNDLTTVQLPSTLTTIGDAAFKLNKLTSLTLPSSVTSVGVFSFLGNYISSLTLDNALTTISGGAFGLNKITQVTIPNGVMTVNSSVFYLQSDLGRDLAITAPPSAIQATYDKIWFVKLFTADPLNPHHLVDKLISEQQYFGSDYDGDGSTLDSMGGYIVNPASLTINYHDAQGATLAQSTTNIGQGVASYMGIANPTLDASLYFHMGSAYTISPQTIAGYVTPASVQMTLAAASNQQTFVYSLPLVAAAQVTAAAAKPTSIVPVATARNFANDSNAPQTDEVVPIPAAAPLHRSAAGISKKTNNAANPSQLTGKKQHHVTNVWLVGAIGIIFITWFVVWFKRRTA